MPDAAAPPPFTSPPPGERSAGREESDVEAAAAEEASAAGVPDTEIPAVEVPPAGHPAAGASAAEAPPDASSTSQAPAGTRSRAGRDLGAAIAVGLGLGAAVLAALILYRPAFAVLVGIAVLIAINEISRAFGVADIAVPQVPVLLGGVAMLIAAWFRGLEGLSVALLFTAFAVIVWRMVDSADGYLASASTGVFIATYVPFLGAFAVLLAVPDDGAVRVVAWALAVVCSDTGGYASGVFLGKHPMAPTISPKKSWEGLTGSVLAAGLASVLVFTLMLDAQWWQGLAFGVAIALVAVLGDLGESMIKRDIGVKDMGTLLPGHGGAMDRMDSLLPTAPVAWLLLSVFVPV